MARPVPVSSVVKTPDELKAEFDVAQAAIDEAARLIAATEFDQAQADAFKLQSDRQAQYDKRLT